MRFRAGTAHTSSVILKRRLQKQLAEPPCRVPSSTIARLSRCVRSSLNDTVPGMETHVREQLRKLFARHSAIAAVYLFGSEATGTASETSDVDLAVVPVADASPPNKLDLLTELARLGVDDVDLVYLNEVDPIVRYEAVRPNDVVYRHPEFDHGSYVSRVVRHYLDLQPILQRQREAYRKQAEGVHGTA